MKISNQSKVESRKPAVFRLRNFFGARPSTLDPRPSQRGIALVITLILLSVTLVMAVAFLAISRRESASVTTTTDSATARLAAESALAAAESQIIANMNSQNGPGTNNPYNYGLLVSTNYINPIGFDPAAEAIAPNPTNVNYDYTVSGTSLSGVQLQQTIANLFYSPRVPVFIATNGGTDFRFYLDLNRNGRFDTNGNLPVFSSDPTLPYVDNNGVNTANLANAAYGIVTGDPEWVGVLERPDTTHGPNNKFLSRYAFIAIPVGNTLDVNYIHNDATRPDANMVSGHDGFMRNEGVGSWEINLAAFLTDLNTNQWDPPTTENAINDSYAYGTYNGVLYNSGVGFEDAVTLLKYRYNGTYNNLAFGAPAFLNNGIDEYSDGNLMTNTLLPFENEGATYWSGSDNTSHFFSLGDLFNPNNINPTNFINHLQQAGTGISTYDRYTFYRMLSELGTDSTPESGLMNVNYDNIDTSVTNYVPWTPLGFFTNAADRMLRLYTTNWFYASLPTSLGTITTNSYLATYYGLTYTNQMTAGQFGQISGLTNSPYSFMTNQVPAFGITHIPVYMYGQFVYSPAVNRLLQLAANMYDATTNSFYPSVFRPTFLVTNEFGYRNVYIDGYEPITFNGVPDVAAAPLDAPVDVTDTSLLPNAGATDAKGNVYGVPWIIGAKKGFPNFNEFSMQDDVQVTRKLQLTRVDTNSPPNATNQMYVLGLTNSLGIECWNSYTNAYPSTNNFQIVVRDNLWMQMSNGASSVLLANPVYFNQVIQSTNITVWPSNSFVIPLYTNVPVLAAAAYNFGGSFISLGNNPTFADVATTPAGFATFPQTFLFTTNRLQVFMMDNNHVVDYVQFAGPNSSRDLTSEFQNANTAFGAANNDIYYTNGVWSTGLNNVNIPWGIQNQVDISAGQHGDTTYWDHNNATVQAEIDGFLHFLNTNNTSLFGTQSNFMYSTNLAVQAPYTPTVTLYEYTTFQANDPLVHYLQSDLTYSGYDTAAGHELATGVHEVTMPGSTNLPILPDLGRINARYQPWGKNTQFTTPSVSDTNAYNLAFKDPLMKSSDSWDFPTNKFPGIGWLGRVHRGTPWQTVYLKASNVLGENSGFGNIGTNTWALWTGDTQLANNQYFDAANTAPIRDRLLFDLFTAAPNDNATRGQLSVNVGAVVGGRSLAAWSALFSGMVVLTNTTAIPFYRPLTNGWLVIDPAGVNGTNSAVGRLAVGINAARTNFVNPDGLAGAFEHKGDILSTPQLTEQSPFLNTSNTATGGYQQQAGISDELYEWLPQQMMSLVRAPSAPRYVIYCYGQALRPAQNGILTGGSYLGMVTNYQVVTESAARAVIRVDGANTPSPHIVVESFNLLPPD